MGRYVGLEVDYGNGVRAATKEAYSMIFTRSDVQMYNLVNCQIDS